MSCLLKRVLHFHDTTLLLFRPNIGNGVRNISSTLSVQARKPKASKLPQVTADQFNSGFGNLAEMTSASEEVKKMFKLQFACKKEWNKERMAEVVRQFQTRPGDTGTTPVQIAVLSVRIEYLKEHMRNNKKDKHTLRSLLQLIHRQRKLLVYLRKKDFTGYHKTISELNLKPIQGHRFLKSK